MKVIKKNQLVILVIAFMLVTAGYLNYTSKDPQAMVLTSAKGIEKEIVAEENTTGSIGDATLVNSNGVVEGNNAEENEVSNTEETVETIADSQEDYFTSSRLEREKMYSQMIESYQKILESNAISEEQKTIANQEITNINHTQNAIMIAENLIKTKGFRDCIIFVNDKSISVILQAEEIQEEQIAQVQNIIAREMQAEIEDIHISNKYE